MARRIVGIDIDNGMIRTVQLKFGARARPVVEEFLEFEIPRGLDDAGRITDVSALAAALRQLWLTANYKTKDVALGMGNVQVFVREFTVPKMTPEEIRKSLPMLAEGVLPLAPHELIMDFYPFAEIEQEGETELHGLLVAALASSVENLVLAVEQAGLNPVSVDLIPFALVRYFLEGEKPQGVCMLVHIASRIINIIVTIDGVPKFVRIIPIAGALQQGSELLTDDDDDDDLENKFPTAPIPDDVVNAIGANRAETKSVSTVTGPLDIRTSKILKNPESRQEIMRGLRDTISYYNQAHPENPITEIRLAGFGLNQHDFAVELRSNVAGIEVSSMLKSPLGHATGSKSKAADFETPDELTVALALARGAQR